MDTVEPKTNKQMNGYAKKKQTHMYRKQSSDSQRRKASAKGQDTGMGLTDTNYYTQNR